MSGANIGSYTQIPSLSDPLEKQIDLLRQVLPQVFGEEMLGALLTGSCSLGKATYRSDIDVLVILKNGPLNYGRVVDLRKQFDRAVVVLQHPAPLPFQINFVLLSVFATAEPAMRDAIKSAIVLNETDGAMTKGLEKLRRISS